MILVMYSVFDSLVCLTSSVIFFGSLSDEDLAIEHQTYLTNLSHRTLALAPGRGILSFGTCSFPSKRLHGLAVFS
jgi:hypothetical protein